MLWYKSWLETRWRFAGGLVLLLLSAGSTVALYPEVVRLLPAASNLELQGEIGRRVAESAELAHSYRGYVWSQWFRHNMPQLWTLMAIVLGTGGLLSQAAGGGALFTLSLPVSRRRLMSVRAAVVAGELLVLALIPAVIFPLLSPGVGESYAMGDAFVHSACMFTGGLVFFALAFLLSSAFGDIWRPLLLAVCVAFVLGLLEQLSADVARFGVFRVMSGESYFRGNGVPWLGLLASAVVSAVMLSAATRNISRQDF
ncbi:MAG TPA: hypothetical protein VMO26_11565 [Vicinamibacterales bacterium]|nr:hypothetical protein [Vicinamibacterales bacterium]